MNKKYTIRLAIIIILSYFGTHNNVIYANNSIAVQNIYKIAAGRNYELFLKSDATVWALGSYGYSNDVYTNTPIQLIKLTDVVSVAGGKNHSVALKSDGTVWAWGDPNYYTISGTSKRDWNVPSQISQLSDIKAIAVGPVHTIALKNDGTVWTLGLDGINRIGFSRELNKAKGLTNVISISGGQFYTLALKKDGTVWAWGSNRILLERKGGKTDILTPIQVKGLKDIVNISAGEEYAVALKKDGTVWIWGNYDGGMGYNTPKVESDRGISGPTIGQSLIQIKGLKDVISVSQCGHLTAALKKDGSVWVWGMSDLNPAKENTYIRIPTQLDKIKDAISVVGREDNLIVLKKDGTVWQYGTTSFGYKEKTSTHSPDPETGLMKRTEPLFDIRP